uniref:Duplicated coat protein n=1 Tax=Cucumber yellows virus TaxID=32618 RepID=Q806Z1_9CLOS|nr:duplicated coat protein [Cucumber yellows virus]
METERQFDEGVPDEDQELSARAASPYLFHNFTLPLIESNTLEFDVNFHDHILANSIILYIRFHIKDAQILYKIDGGNFGRQSIQQVGGSFFSLRYTEIAKPKLLNNGVTNSFAIVPTNDSYLVKIKGWNCYGIKKSFDPTNIEFAVSFPIKGFSLTGGRTYEANVISLADIFQNFKINGVSSSLGLKAYVLYGAGNKTSFNVVPKRTLNLNEVANQSSLELMEKKERTVPELPDISTSQNSAYDSQCFRLYDVYAPTQNPKSKVRITGSLKPISCREVRSILQLWFGDLKNMLELLVDCDPIRNKEIQMKIFYRKNGNSTYLTSYIQKAIPVQEKGNLKLYEFGFNYSEDGVFEIITAGRTSATFKLKIPVPKLQVGYEFQFTKELSDPKNVGKLKKLINFGRIALIEIDGKKIELSPVKVAEGTNQTSVSLCAANPPIDAEEVKEIKDMLVVKNDKPEIVENEKEVVDVTQNDEVSNLSANYIASVTSPISDISLRRIFEKVRKHYVDSGIKESDAELLIYQMGVSFCTSKNAMSDNSNFIFWKTVSGTNKRFSKSAHSRMLNNQTSQCCNVERLLLRSRSLLIFNLLKRKQLEWPHLHAQRRGLRPEFAYMACDFYDLKALPLSEAEILALNESHKYSLFRNKHKRTIVNVNQIA